MKYSELFAPNSASVREDILDKMRADDPIFWCDHEAIRAWFVTRYDDVFTLFNDDRLEFGSVKAELLKQPKEQQEELQPLIITLDNLMSSMPRERHKKIQKILLEFLSMRFLKTFQGTITDIVDHAIDNIQNEPELNIVKHFSYPIPAHVVASMIGVPQQDWDKFISWSSAMEALFWPYDYQRYRKANDSINNMMKYFRELMPQTVIHNKESLLARFAKAVKDGEVTENEALVNCATMMFAGHETTATVINAGVSLLFEKAGLLETLRANPSLMHKATQEILRYKPAVGWMRRTAVDDFEYKGQKIKKHDVVYLGNYAANRDPEVFPDPHRFDIHREFKKPALTFGVGRHYCLGAALAQMEIELALSKLIQQFPEMHLDLSQVKRTPTMMLMDAIVDLPLELNITEDVVA